MNPIPVSIKRNSEGIQITWRDGHRATYSYAYLRRNCPCAECRAKKPRVITAEDPFRLIDDQPIFADDASLVGNYAVRFHWNDSHSHGIYSFEHLRAICPCDDCLPG